MAPRLCWWCSRKSWGKTPLYALVKAEIFGHPRMFHKACLKKAKHIEKYAWRKTDEEE